MCQCEDRPCCGCHLEERDALEGMDLESTEPGDHEDRGCYDDE